MSEHNNNILQSRGKIIKNFYICHNVVQNLVGEGRRVGRITFSKAQMIQT